MGRPVLIADGDHARAERVAAACEELGLATEVTSHGAAALELAIAEVPAVVVLQLRLPLIDGVQLAGILRANPRTEAIEVVLLADSPGDTRRTDLPGEVVPLAADAEDTARLVQTLVEKYQAHIDDGETQPIDGGVEGQLSQLPLADLLQLFHVSRKTGTVELRRGDGSDAADSGEVVMRGGDLVHAEVGAVVGPKALYRLLAWNRGDFNFRPEESPAIATIDKPTRGVLREGLRQIEEWARIAGSLPALDAEIRLKIRRTSLPSVIHPLTQEVLLVLETHSRVGDVVEHCTFPDYQVLRTLHTLIRRGIVEVRRDPAFSQAEVTNFFSPARGARLRDWLGLDRPGGATLHNAKLLVVPSAPAATRAFGRLLGSLPGAQVSLDLREGAPAVEEVGPLGRLPVDADVGIDFVQMPAAPRFAPLWALGGHGALGTLLLLSGDVGAAVASIRQASEVLRQLPRARIFHLLLLEKGTGVEPEVLRENLSLFDDSSLFLIPLDNEDTASVLMREMFVRILP